MCWLFDAPVAFACVHRNFFDEGRVSTKQLYIVAGMEFTSGDLLKGALDAAGVSTAASATTAALLPSIGFGESDKRFNQLFNTTASTVVGIVDMPAGEFVLELAHAFPNHSIALSVLPVRQCRGIS